MTLKSFSHTVRFIAISVLLGAALAALFTAWCLAAIALWLIQRNTTAAPVILPPAMPMMSAAAPVRLCLPPAAPFYPVKKLAILTTINAIASVGIALATTNQVLVTPVRLALPANITAPGADFEDCSDWLDERQAIIDADLEITAKPVSVQISEVLNFAKSFRFESNEEAIEQVCKVESKSQAKAIAKMRKQRTADLSQMTVTQLRKLAKERGLTRISKLRKDELIAALV